jgi:hypothetical protein
MLGVILDKIEEKLEELEEIEEILDTTKLKKHIVCLDHNIM